MYEKLPPAAGLLSSDIFEGSVWWPLVATLMVNVCMVDKVQVVLYVFLLYVHDSVKYLITMVPGNDTSTNSPGMAHCVCAEFVT